MSNFSDQNDNFAFFFTEELTMYDCVNCSDVHVSKTYMGDKKGDRKFELSTDGSTHNTEGTTLEPSTKIYELMQESCQLWRFLLKKKKTRRQRISWDRTNKLEHVLKKSDTVVIHSKGLYQETRVVCNDVILVDGGQRPALERHGRHNTRPIPHNLKTLKTKA